MESAEDRPSDETTAHDHDEEEEHGHPFWPTHVIDQVIQWYLWVGIILTFVLLRPLKLHEEANPLVTPDWIKPEWYFLATYQALKYVPELLGILGIGLVGVAFVIWPVIDSRLERRFPGKRLHAKIATVGLIIAVGLSILGKVSHTHVNVFGTRYFVDDNGIPRQVTAEEAAESPEGEGH